MTPKPFQVGTLGPHTVLPVSLPLLKTLYKILCWNRHQLPCCIFPESHRWSEISSLSRVILVLGKARSFRASNLGCSGAESSGWYDVLQKTLYETWCMSRHVVLMKLPITSCPQLWLFLSYCISQPMKNIKVVLLINWPEGAYSWWTTPSQSKSKTH